MPLPTRNANGYAVPSQIQRDLFDEDKPVVVPQRQRFDFSGITDAEFFEQAEAEVVEALRNYAERATNGKRLQWRLFSDDTLRGFAFVDICHQQFDVLLMNSTVWTAIPAITQLSRFRVQRSKG